MPKNVALCSEFKDKIKVSGQEGSSEYFFCNRKGYNRVLVPENRSPLSVHFAGAPFLDITL